MGEDRLGEWILQTAREWAVLTEKSEPELPAAPPDWAALAAVPDEELATWARLLLKEMYEVTDATFRKRQANRARQGFAEIEAILGTLGAMLFFAQRFVPGGREPYGWLLRLWTIVGTGETAARGAATTGTAPSLGLYGISVSSKTGSHEYLTLKRYAVGAMNLFEAAGQSRRSAAEKVSKILARNGVEKAGMDVVRNTWRKSVEEEDEQYFGMRSADALLLGWIGRDVLDSWRLERDRCRDNGKPEPDFGSWSLALRQDLLSNFIPRMLGEQAENWKDECAAWGKEAP